MKPLEFKVEFIPQVCGCVMTFYYADGTSKSVIMQNVYEKDVEELGLELNKHYSITDIYGYQVKNDREGL